MDKTIILKNALELIAAGTVDVQYPLRCAPREILMKYAKDALTRYADAILTPVEDRQAKPCRFKDDACRLGPDYPCGACAVYSPAS